MLIVRSSFSPFDVEDVDVAAEEVEVASLRIGNGVADRFAFHGDLAQDGEIGEGHDRRALVAAVGDVEPRAGAVGAHRDELFGRRDLGGVENELVLDVAALRIDGHDRLRLRETDVDGAVGADRDAVRIAGKLPALDDFLVARGDGSERLGAHRAPRSPTARSRELSRRSSTKTSR